MQLCYITYSKFISKMHVASRVDFIIKTIFLALYVFRSGLLYVKYFYVEIKLCRIFGIFVSFSLYGRWELYHGLYLYIQFVMTSMWMDDSGERLSRDSRPSEAGFIQRDPPDKSKEVLLPGARDEKNYYLSFETNFLVCLLLADIYLVCGERFRTVTDHRELV